MLNDVRRIVDEGHLGVRTYEQFVQGCLQRAAAGDPEAVSLFVFAKLVQPFSDYYFDQALSEARAVSFRNQLLAGLDAYEAAATLEEKQAVLRDAIRKGLEGCEP
jgi:hypothetical protein